MRKFAFLLYPSFQMLGLVSAVEALRVANSICEEPVYEWEFLSDGAPAIPASSGFLFETPRRLADADTFDILIVTASFRHSDYSSARTDAVLRRLARLGKTLGSFESGIYHLAKSGVMDGHRAAAHFHNRPLFEQLFPRVDFIRRLFTCENGRMTAAGGTACLDLMLHVIERDLGPVMAARVAALIAHPLKKNHELFQDGLLTAPTLGHQPAVRAACRLLEENIDSSLRSVEDVADAVGLSRRHLDRMFQTAFNCTMAGYLRQIRLARARKLVKGTRVPFAEIGAACGFVSYSNFLNRYRDQYGVLPSQDRVLPNLSPGGLKEISPANDLHPVQAGLDRTRMI